MIARIWHGWAPQERADICQRHGVVHQEVVFDLR
jgi:hypothetical protein